MPRFLVTALVTALAAALVTVAPAAPALALDDGLARTPPMGFNDWNAFGCDVSEELIKQTADLFVAEGLKDAGYTYVNIDDCWSLKDRDPSTGRLVPDPVKFPSGIAGTADYVHGKGLKLGIYGDAGTNTCAGYPGSLGHETLDARTFADWGVDYLKYDNCYNRSDGTQADYVRRYTAMRDALAATKRPIVFSICEWGTTQPWTWGPDVGHLWRTTEDISDNWPSLREIIAANAPLHPYAGPGHWNDPDMLEIGNGGMTPTEYRTHMSMWAMMAAPLIIGTDLRTASPETLGILTNREIIGIDQDKLGIAGRVVADAGGLMVLDKPLSGGEHAIALYNSTDVLATVGTTLGGGRAWRLQDVWTGAVTQSRSRVEAAVPAHGTVVYKVRPLRDPGPIAPSVTAAASIGTVTPATPVPLTTTITNRGTRPIHDVRVSVAAAPGWTVSAVSGSRARSLGPDRSLTGSWTVTAPADVPAGAHPLTVSTSYTWGSGHRSSTASTLVATVVTPPPGGTRYLSTVRAADSTNALGPVELDRSNGGAAPGDGNLITIGGRVYTRGLGTSGPSSIRYYLGGSCGTLTTDVGVDDTSTAPADFTIYGDETVLATAPAAPGAAPQSLRADLTGVTWLRLAVTGAGHGDWAAPILTCGAGGPLEPAERTLFSFEGGTDGFTTANAGAGGTVEPTTAFHTDGASGLLVHTPVDGNWFGRVLATPLDLSAFDTLAFDMRVETAGSVGEIAVQVGDAYTWCQGGRWTWSNPGGSRTVTRSFDEISCPSGTTLDRSDIRAVWVYLNTGGDVAIDNVRASAQPTGLANW